VRRIVWSSPPAPTTFTDPRNGRQYLGMYRVRIVLFEAGEPLTKRQDGREIPLTRKVAAWRAKAGTGAPVRVEPIHDRMPVSAMEIPDTVFAALPPDADIVVHWEFVPEKAL